MIKKLPPHILSVVMLGVVSQIAQVVLLRELLMVFHGNELSIGLILAAWLVWVGMGSRLGAALAARVNRSLHALTLSTVGVLLTLPATILLIRCLRSFFNILPGAYLSLLDMLISCFLLMAPVCLLLGMQFVLLSRVWRKSNNAEDTSGAAKTYIGEAVGNMFGGILFTLLMVHYLDSFQSALLAGALMFLAILTMTRKLQTGAVTLSVRFRLTLLGLLLALAAIALPFMKYLNDWMYAIQWRYLTPQHELVEIQQSKYGAISVMRRDDQYSFFQSGHLIFATAGPETTASGLEDQEAVTFAHLAMVQHEKPEYILLIGGGLRGTIREIARHPVARIDYIELDEKLTEVALRYVSPSTLATLKDPRVRLIHTDGRLFVKTTDEKYDMIIVDTPDPITAALNRFYTREFFLEAETLLNPGGVFVVGTTSTPDLCGTAIANRNATIYHTLKSVFSRVLVAGERFMFYFATNAPEQISLDVSVLQERYRARNIKDSNFSHHHYHTLLQESQLRRVNWIVRNHGRAPDAHLQGAGPVPLFTGTVAEQERAEKELPPVETLYFINSDFKPIAYYYTVMFWDDLARVSHKETFKWPLYVEFWWILPLVCLPLSIVLALRVATRRIAKNTDTRFAVLFAVFATGLSAMVLQIALLFSFQNIYGFVYEKVGLIVAMFMGGLALGTFLTQRFVADKQNLQTLTRVQLLMTLFASMFAIVLHGTAALQSPAIVFILFSVLTFGTGVINGVNFPLAAASFWSLNRCPERSAGAVYSVELVGACVGAALASAVVAPILGIIACCLWAGIANGTAFVTLLICRRSYV